VLNVLSLFESFLKKENLQEIRDRIKVTAVVHLTFMLNANVTLESNRILFLHCFERISEKQSDFFDVNICLNDETPSECMRKQNSRDVQKPLCTTAILTVCRISSYSSEGSLFSIRVLINKWRSTHRRRRRLSPPLAFLRDEYRGIGVTTRHIISRKQNVSPRDHLRVS
jgi:hypothetical protein